MSEPSLSNVLHGNHRHMEVRVALSKWIAEEAAEYAREVSLSEKDALPTIPSGPNRKARLVEFTSRARHRALEIDELLDLLALTLAATGFYSKVELTKGLINWAAKQEGRGRLFFDIVGAMQYLSRAILRKREEEDNS